jgi:hypothetical protein
MNGVEIPGLRSYIFDVRRLCFLLLLASSLCAQRAPENVPFDKPLTKVRDLGLSPYYQPSQHMRKKLTCYQYPTFMVKEYDEGQKGAEWLSIISFQQSKRPACSLSHVRGEKVIEWQEWSGYFKGGKDSFAFFDADDGANAGLPFAVYDTRTKRKVFEDSARLRGGNPERASMTDFHMSRDDKQQLVLRYVRVVSADCNVMKKGDGCWNQFKAKYGIATKERPTCRGYEHDDERTPSAVGYPVRVILSKQPHVKTVDGPIDCWPVD